MRHYSIARALLRNKLPYTNWSAKFTQSVAFYSGKKETNTTNSDEEKSCKKTQATRSQEALDKLNLLLKQMITDDASTVHTKKLGLAKPKSKRLMQKEPGEQEAKLQTTGQKMVQAVKDVAAALGDNIKKTESELLMKLLSTSTDTTKSATNLSDIVKDMKVDRTSNTEKQSRAEKVRQILQNTSSRHRSPMNRLNQRSSRKQAVEAPLNIQKIDLFGGERLGILVKIDIRPEENENKTWNKLYAKELKLAVTHPPTNYFQHMILWTEQGKIWKFPIDNEEGWEEEKNVCFTEHIFLEKHLSPWCPTKGPIRHFMELVCVGLSKNPYLSVDAKKEHIFWYRDYFADKKKLLQDVGAIAENTKIGF